MTKMDIVGELVDTRINGNSIMNNKTYVNMLRRVKKEDINEYANEYGMADLYGSKLEMIEQIRDHITGNRREL